MKKRVHIPMKPLSEKTANTFLKEITSNGASVILENKRFNLSVELIVDHHRGVFVLTTSDSRVEEYNAKNQDKSLMNWFEDDDQYENYIKHLRCEKTKSAPLSEGQLFELITTGKYYIG